MKEFTKLTEFTSYISNKKIRNITAQALNLTKIEDLMLATSFKDCLFLGCKMSKKVRKHLFPQNQIFPKMKSPFDNYPTQLYNYKSLYANFEYWDSNSYEATPDKIIYDHYIKTGKDTLDIRENLARRLHDHSITDALREFLAEYSEKKVIAIMGGHKLNRGEETYNQIALFSKMMTEKGYLLVSGGGPGAMEATHLGAWFAGRKKAKLKEAISILEKAPGYKHKQWLSTAFQVLQKYPKPIANYKSLGIPTWRYGHEPATPFATHIAKYFANSVREEGLLAVAKGGILFTPGSAGTMQEIFQDICQNHYQSFGYASPMIFLDKEYWSYDRPIYPILELMTLRGDLTHLDLAAYDDSKDIVKHFDSFSGS